MRLLKLYLPALLLTVLLSACSTRTELYFINTLNAPAAVTLHMVSDLTSLRENNLTLHYTTAIIDVDNNTVSLMTEKLATDTVSSKKLSFELPSGSTALIRSKSSNEKENIDAVTFSFGDSTYTVSMDALLETSRRSFWKRLINGRQEVYEIK